MASGVVYEGAARRSGADEVAGDDNANKLFSGLKLWFSHAVPLRKWYSENAALHGAEIVQLEKQADVRLVDHVRKNNAPGTHSYQFVELSIKNGRLEDLDAHRVGATSSVNRPVGSTVTGPKGTRTPFTNEEDQFLWNTITPLKEKGGAFKGNEIYKQIAALRPQHTYQSWRDRYIKHVQYQNRIMTAQVDLEAEKPEVEQAERATTSAELRPSSSTTAAKRPSPEAVGSRKRPRTEGNRTESSAAASSETHRQRTSPARRSPEVLQRSQVDGPPSSPSERKPVTVGLQPSIPPPPMSHRIPSPQKRERTQQKEQLATPSPPKQRESTPRATPNTASPRQESPKPNEYPDTYPFSFTRNHYRQLFRATRSILDTDTEKLGAAFDAVAEDNQELEHSGRDWRLFWQYTVLPFYCRQFNINPDTIDPAAKIPNVWSLRRRPPSRESELAPTVECAQCLTKDTTRWRRDKQGRTLCNDCGRLFKESRLRSLSGPHAEVPGSPEAESDTNQERRLSEKQGHQQVRIKEEAEALPPITPNARMPAPTPISTARSVAYSDAGVQTSPLLEPRQVKTEDNANELQSELPDLRPPGPNEARKRSIGRGSQSISQETARSQEIVATPTKSRNSANDGTHEQEETGESSKQASSTAFSRDRQRQPSPEVLEIPSTPEHTGTERGRLVPEETVFDSPAQQLQTSLRHSSPDMPREKSAQYHASPNRRREDSDSFEIVLMDDESPSKARASSPELGQRDETPSSESHYNFETAPSVSQEWETAPQSPTRPERRVSTQVLFQQSHDLEESYAFDLPEPEGGWEQLGISESMPRELDIVDLTADDGELHPMESASQSGDAHRDSWSLITPPPAMSREPSPPPRADEDMAEEADFEIDEWLAAQLKLYPADVVRPSLLEDLLSTAIDATSFDYDLAASIIPEMIATSKTSKGRALRKAQRWKGLLPASKRGVWTETDDLVMGPDVDDHALERVFNKHGEAGAIARREFLQAYAEA